MVGLCPLVVVSAMLVGVSSPGVDQLGPLVVEGFNKFGKHFPPWLDRLCPLVSGLR